MCVLYIPFWLNLYLLTRKDIPIQVALHSILVKSIRVDRTMQGSGHELYIPFWLNLYRPHADYFEMNNTLHSILVKSIQNSRSALERRCLSLYIPFWLNLYIIIRRNIHILWKLYIPFWLNLYRNRLFLFLMRWSTLHSILVKSIRLTGLSRDPGMSFTFHSG